MQARVSQHGKARRIQEAQPRRNFKNIMQKSKGYDKKNYVIGYFCPMPESN